MKIIFNSIFSIFLFLCLTNPQAIFFFSKAPHHLSNNADDEDIDIVGDDPTNNNNNRNMSLSSSDASRELQLHVYGPPQFSEADVLSCISQIEEEEEEETRRRETEGFIKTEARSPDNDRMKEESEDIAEDGEEGAEGRRQEMEDVEALKAKLKQLEGSTKCSKCVVSFHPLNVIKRYYVTHLIRSCLCVMLSTT